MRWAAHHQPAEELALSGGQAGREAAHQGHRHEDAANSAELPGINRTTDGLCREIHGSPDVPTWAGLLRWHRGPSRPETGGTVSEHPNVTVINRMTKAVFENDRDTLSELFTDDMTTHVRGPLPRPGDHEGVTGFLEAIGAIFELTDGDVKIEQLFCVADGQWAAEWEHAVLGRKGRTLETKNMFVYDFVGDRIADLWMICAAPSGSESFWD